MTRLQSCDLFVILSAPAFATVNVTVTLFSMTTLQLRSLASRLWRVTPTLTRPINNSRPALTPILSTSDSSGFSSPQSHLESFKSPADFLKAIGRSCETKVSVESWDEFWKKDGPSLKKDGVPVRDRRYAFCSQCLKIWIIKKSCNGLPLCSDISCGVCRNIA